MTIENIYSQFFVPGNVCTDSRKTSPGDIFIALKGDYFDGDEFAESALKQGARIAIVSDKSLLHGKQIIKVNDTLAFLQDLARYHRIKGNLNIIGLTGTNGKTTTKELIRSVLSQKYRVQSTQGNLNNHIGVPLTILSILPETERTIVEMGANHPGEIKLLCEIAMPQCGLITNIGKAHLEGFGSYEGVKKAKAELYDYIKNTEGKIYYNASDNTLCDLVGNYNRKIEYNSLSGNCSGEIITGRPSLIIEIRDSQHRKEMIKTKLFGNYNFTNIMAAVCVGLDMSVSLEEIKTGIENYNPDSYRSQIIVLGNVQIILDCYNANPTSMEQALKSFSEYPGDSKVVLLGGMKELGESEKEEHQKLGRLIETLNFDTILLTGSEFAEIHIPKALYFDNFQDLEDYVRHTNFEHSTMLIKGSRANQLEKLAEIIRKKYS